MTDQRLKAVKRYFEVPINWNDCTPEQLAWLAENGSYGQRQIAKRWIEASNARDLTVNKNQCTPSRTAERI